MAGSQINTLLDIWAASLVEANGKALFSHHRSSHTPDHSDIYQTIDCIELGDVKWESFVVCYSGDRPADRAPPWMDNSYVVYFCSPCEVVQNILSNPKFSGKMDYRPYREFILATNECQWYNLMSGDWAWNQAVRNYVFSFQ